LVADDIVLTVAHCAGAFDGEVYGGPNQQYSTVGGAERIPVQAHYLAEVSNGLDLLSQGSILEGITARLKTAAQCGEQLLHASGGNLELPKCFYYLLHWVFDSGGHAPLATPC
jgi:hypothetical protein